MADLFRNEVSMVRSKQCFKCGENKVLSDFYVHPMMGDGHLGKCKECAKRDVRVHRELNIEKIRAYDRARASLPHRRELNQTITKAWLQEDKRRAKCHNALTRAVRKGMVQRMPCIVCGAAKSLAHHPDYDKPLDVMWLCQICHKKEHARMKSQILSKF